MSAGERALLPVEQANDRLRAELKIAYRRAGGIARLARAPHGAQKIVEIAVLVAASERIAAETDKKARLNAVISHATGGAVQNGSTMGLNDIGVAISQHHNRVWKAAETAAYERGKRDAAAELDEWIAEQEIEAVRELLESLKAAILSLKDTPK